jgi:hypothetical protein
MIELRCVKANPHRPRAPPHVREKYHVILYKSNQIRFSSDAFRGNGLCAIATSNFVGVEERSLTVAARQTRLP